MPAARRIHATSPSSSAPRKARAAEGFLDLSRRAAAGRSARGADAGESAGESTWVWADFKLVHLNMSVQEFLAQLQVPGPPSVAALLAQLQLLLLLYWLNCSCCCCFTGSTAGGPPAVAVAADWRYRRYWLFC